MRSILQNILKSLLTFRILFTHLKLRRSEENHHLLSSGAKRRQNELRIFLFYFLHNKKKVLIQVFVCLLIRHDSRARDEKRVKRCVRNRTFSGFCFCFSSLAHILTFLLFISFTSFYFYFHFCFWSFFSRLLCFILRVFFCSSVRLIHEQTFYTWNVFCMFCSDCFALTRCSGMDGWWGLFGCDV